MAVAGSLPEEGQRKAKEVTVRERQRITRAHPTPEDPCVGPLTFALPDVARRIEDRSSEQEIGQLS